MRHEGCAGGEAALCEVMMSRVLVQGAGEGVCEEAGRAEGDLRDWGCGLSGGGKRGSRDENCEALQ